MSIMQQPAAKLDFDPTDYLALLENIKQRIRTAQVRAALAVNRELVVLYWEIGRTIVERQDAEGWGKSVVDRLAQDLQAEFPGIAGFSASSIWRMRAFYLAWPSTNHAQAAREMESGSNLAQPVREIGKSAELADPLRETEHAKLPQAVAGIPWGHNITLFEKLTDPTERLWYAQKTIENGWSRNVLVHQIESDLYHRQGGAISNFHATLPAPQSDLAHQLLKDPYVFDFLTLTEEAQERELEQALIDQVEKMLLEFGHGFALMGRQYHLDVGGNDFYLDLLFYHHQLRCLVVVDLKVDKFKPEFAGKMQFYLSTVDDLVRHPDDGPSIGLIICKDRNRVIAEYALRDTRRPIGISEYVLTQNLPPEIKRQLPSVDRVTTQLQVNASDKLTLSLTEAAKVSKR